ncbi:uncharacterized protein LOC135194589 [Vanessa tameamea]|uniref:Uncharacterized protein LOC135194589 n=1 Tax=Vanessa tameamea TaxID=334116 RepID=A0ABM4AY77_VANTA
MLVVRVDLLRQSQVYVCLYRSHNGDLETSQLFDHLSRVADLAQEQFPYAELVFLGDFKAHHESWLNSFKIDHAGRTTHAFALMHDFTQLVDQPTRIPDIDGQGPSLLDLLLTSHSVDYRVVVQIPLGSSDHSLISTKVPQPKLLPTNAGKRSIWHYKSAEWDVMRDYFASVPWKECCFSGKDPTARAAAVPGEILLGMEYYIPNSDLISRGMGNRWSTRECGDAVSSKQAAYRSWINGCASRAPNIDSLKATYNKESKSWKKTYIRAVAQRIVQIGHDLISHHTSSRSFWRLTKSVHNNFCQPSLPPLRNPNGSVAYSPQEKADLLAKLFAHNSVIDDCSALPPKILSCGHTMPDIKIRQRDVRAELQSLDVWKANGSNGIPAIVLKKCAAELSPVLTRLFHLSLSTGCEPEA